jgi:hypothetical protein
MNWTKEMLDAVKGNEVPHGLLKANTGKYFRTSSAVPLWQLIQLAAKAGAQIEMWNGARWESTIAHFLGDCTYRVCPSWQPPEEQGEVERCEVRTTGSYNKRLIYFRDGNVPLCEAINDPDFVCFVYYADGHKRPDPRVMQGNDKPALAPVAVLFRRRT